MFAGLVDEGDKEFNKCIALLFTFNILYSFTLYAMVENIKDDITKSLSLM